MQQPTPHHAIFDIASGEQFERMALETFRFQVDHCEIYRSFIALLGIEPSSIRNIREIPFLPIELFKTHTIYGGSLPPQYTFTSSATSGMVPAKHHIADISIYEESFTRAFRLFYGAPEHYTILALLPSYLERDGSSLIYMVDKLMNRSGGFFLDNHKELYERLSILNDQKRPTILWGVTFALLDFIRNHPIHFPELIVMETGGMKGRGMELNRSELHEKLKQGFGTVYIHSEYGMAELLSQAYSKERGLFKCPPWMRILIRDLYDPFRLLPHGQIGGVNIIDLANRYSCSFIETQDLGKLHPDHTFELLGRIPFSELRGCNLLLA